MLVFADVLSYENKLVFYNHKVGWIKNIPLIQKAKGKKVPFNCEIQPLKLECKAFVDWVTKDKKPLSDVEEGLRVLKVLELAKKDLMDW